MTRGTSARWPTSIAAPGSGRPGPSSTATSPRDRPRASGGSSSPPDASEDERAVWDGLRAGAIGASDPRRLRAYWLYRMLFGGDPLRERLTLFWHGHFATSLTKVDSVTALVRTGRDAPRTRALGGFAGLLDAIIADPAMLVWLDGGTSQRERPNENFAREFLELFTLGQGAYSERDIREAARAFTGWVPEGRHRTPGDSNPKFAFDDEAHDPGPKTFLGQAGNWKAADIVRITLARPEAARHLAGKLYRAFVAEEPEPAPELIEPLAEVLRSSDFSIQRAMQVILSSRHFYSRASYRRRIKSPVEYTVGLLRMLEVPRTNVSLMAAATACARQGQELFAPPSVKGWDGGKSWINSSTLLERLNWATDVDLGQPRSGHAPVRPGRLARGTRRATRGGRRGLRQPAAPGRPRPRGQGPGPGRRLATAARTACARPCSACSIAPNSSLPDRPNRREERP